jgi:hypothetical protein
MVYRGLHQSWVHLLLSFSGSGSPFSGVAGGWGGVVCVLERDMMIASCHGGIREGGLQRRWIALALNK